MAKPTPLVAEDAASRPSGARCETPQSLLPRRLWRICQVSAWLTTLALLAVAALRVFYHDGAFPLIWLNSFTRYVYLPAYLCLAWALWRQRWLLLLTNLIVISCHLMWLAPDYLRDRRFEVAAEASPVAANSGNRPSVRIFFANVAADNTEYSAMLDEIGAANPDVIVLVEYSWGWHRAFKASPRMAPYVYGTGHLQSHIGSVNVFSKLPLKTEMQNWVDGRAMHSVEFDLGGRALRLIGLHAPRPINQPKYDYRGYWQQALPLLTARQGPLVVVGDFNLTQHSAIYEQLTAGLLRSAHEAVGRGYATTWPNGEYWLPPIRIDQAFLSPEVECRSIFEGRGRGSDHKPLVVDVCFRAGQGTGPASASKGRRGL